MKKHGWVIQEDGDRGFVDEDCGGYYDFDDVENSPNPVENAKVYNTRKQARETHNKLDDDIIRKVELDDNGVPVKVIPGR